MTALGAFFVASWLDDRKRAKLMADLAGRIGFKMWGDKLPPELSLVGTPMAAATATWNVMEGTQGGVPVIAFGCRMGAGTDQTCALCVRWNGKDNGKLRHCSLADRHAATFRHRIWQ